MDIQEEINATLWLLGEGEAEFDDIMFLVNNTVDEEAVLGPAPQILVDAITGVYASERDFENGGADQFVWNHGSESARLFGEAWCEVGAIENGEMLLRLGEKLDRYHEEFSSEAIQENITQHFLAYRLRCGIGWRTQDIKSELHEAVVEWSITNIDLFIKR